MYVWSSYIAEYGPTGQGCQSCSRSAKQGKLIFPVSRSRLRILAVPSRVSLLILHTLAESSAYSRDSSGFPRRHPFLYLKTAIRHRASPEFIGSCNCVVMMFTDCRESAGTRPVVLKVVPVTGAALAGHHGAIIAHLSYTTPIVVME